MEAERSNASQMRKCLESHMNRGNFFKLSLVRTAKYECQDFGIALIILYKLYVDLVKIKGFPSNYLVID